MSGSDDHVAVMGDWMSPIPVPRTFYSSMTSDDFVSGSMMGFDSEDFSGPSFPAQKGPTQASVGGNEASNSNAPAEQKSSSPGNLVERIAARAGFNAPRLNTESIRTQEMCTRPDVQSAYLTIPPGLSPTTLLESPVFLSNSLAQPSPTTGKLLSRNNRDSPLMTENRDKVKENTFEDIHSSSFEFKHVIESVPFPYFNAANKSFPIDGVSVHSDASLLHQNTNPPNFHSENNNAMFQLANFCKSRDEDNGGTNLSPDQSYNSIGVADHSPPLDEQHEDGDQRIIEDPNVGGTAGEDGYNWRKYGQKQVKGSEHPRSYYKCTYQNCPVKKKVERSYEGHIREIIYKGAHNHPKPPPNRRSALGSSNTLSDMQLNTEQCGTGASGDLIWSVMQRGNVAGSPDWKQDNLDPASYGNGAASTLPGQSGAPFELGDGVEELSNFSNNEDDDRATHGSASLGYDGEGDELESKRRRIETYAPEMSGASRAMREPRVVVQTTSEVDILDDGYRWRKYGQKVVKGNPNPRSYYKCTSPGCNVRKHVERACNDLKAVITTYEGKHNHDVPAPRNTNSGVSNAPPTQQPPAVSNHIARPEPVPIRGRTTWFERPPLAPYNLLSRPQVGPGPPGLGFGMNQASLASLGLAGFGPHQGKLLPPLPGHLFIGNNQAGPMSGMGYMMPKEEPKMELVTDTGLNSSNGASVYQQFMSGLPLGPQM